MKDGRFGHVPGLIDYILETQNDQTKEHNSVINQLEEQNYKLKEELAVTHSDNLSLNRQFENVRDLST